jgi:hypothetical protein
MIKLHDQGPVKFILGMKIEHNHVAQTIAISQPGYIESILNQFGMAECNPAQTPMDENQKLSTQMSLDDPEKQKEMKAYPYQELVGKLLYLAIAT